MFSRKDKKGSKREGVDEENLVAVPQRHSEGALSVCPTCGRPSDGKAEVCVGCGAPLKGKPVWK
jgi:predicted amidophosphoribosyltransferase